MSGLVWGVAAEVIRSGAAEVILMLNFPAFVVALIANRNAHDPSNVVWVLASAAQWALIASHFVKPSVSGSGSAGPPGDQS